MRERAKPGREGAFFSLEDFARGIRLPKIGREVSREPFAEMVGGSGAKGAPGRKAIFSVPQGLMAKWNDSNSNTEYFLNSTP